jgi:general secretion pathway protein G
MLRTSHGRPATQRGAAPHGSRDGFTLIELLVVMFVIGLLAALVAPDVFRNVGRSKAVAARSQIEMFSASLDAYRLDNDDYPSTEQGLGALRREPLTAPQPRHWSGPYLRKEVPADPWGRAYVYRNPGAHATNGYDLVSYGRDGRPGGAGEDRDVTNWE